MRLVWTLTVLAVLAVPGTASAARFSGKTSQGRAVVMSLDSRGEFAGLVINWRARCDGKGTYFRSKTYFLPRLQKQSTRGFRHANDYVSTQEFGIRSTVSVSVAGRKQSERLWTGWFEASVAVRKSGRTVDRCRLGRLRWSVSRI